MVLVTKFLIAFIFIAYFSIPPVLIAKVYNGLRISRYKKMAMLFSMIIIYVAVTMGVFHYIDVQINEHIRK